MEQERRDYADPPPPLVPAGTLLVLAVLAAGCAALACGLGLVPLFRW